NPCDTGIDQELSTIDAGSTGSIDRGSTESNSMLGCEGYQVCLRMYRVPASSVLSRNAIPAVDAVGLTGGDSVVTCGQYPPLYGRQGSYLSSSACTSLSQEPGHLH